MKYLVIVLTALLLSSPALAEGKKDCGRLCEAYKHAHSRGPVPYRHPTICLAYEQAHVDNLVIRFFSAAGKELDPHDPLHSRKAAPPLGVICPGAHWFREASRAELCNSTEGRWLEKRHLLILLKLGRTPIGSVVHLDLPLPGKQ